MTTSIRSAATDVEIHSPCDGVSCEYGYLFLLLNFSDITPFLWCARAEDRAAFEAAYPGRSAIDDDDERQADAEEQHQGRERAQLLSLQR